MAINLDDRYPNRANPKSIDYPQGSFKNRTAPNSNDGTYLEEDWANDWAAFFQSMISQAGLTANGDVDKVGSSQYYAAMRALTLDPDKNLSELANKGTARTNLGLKNSATRDVGSTNGTVAAGDDSRINHGETAYGWGNHASAGYVKTDTKYTAGTGLNLTGTTFSVTYGTDATSAAVGNDSRITGAMQKTQNLDDVSSKPAARTNLGLGSAATKDVATDFNDQTLERLLKVGSFGWGADHTRNVSVRLPADVDLNEVTANGTYGLFNSPDAKNRPVAGGDAGLLVFGDYHSKVQIFNASSASGLWWRMNNSDDTTSWGAWYELYHTGNILTSTGNDNTLPMSQKAVTDAIAAVSGKSIAYDGAETSVSAPSSGSKASLPTGYVMTGYMVSSSGYIAYGRKLKVS